MRMRRSASVCTVEPSRVSPVRMRRSVVTFGPVKIPCPPPERAAANATCPDERMLAKLPNAVNDPPVEAMFTNVAGLLPANTPCWPPLRLATKATAPDPLMLTGPTKLGTDMPVVAMAFVVTPSPTSTCCEPSEKLAMKATVPAALMAVGPTKLGTIVPVEAMVVVVVPLPRKIPWPPVEGTAANETVFAELIPGRMLKLVKVGVVPIGMVVVPLPTKMPPEVGLVVAKKATVFDVGLIAGSMAPVASLKPVKVAPVWAMVLVAPRRR